MLTYGTADVAAELIAAAEPMLVEHPPDATTPITATTPRRGRSLYDTS